MPSRTPDRWQIEDAEQRFSEMIRAVTYDGPQVITQHGQDIAVVVDIAEYRRLTMRVVDLTSIRPPRAEPDAGGGELSPFRA